MIRDDGMIGNVTFLMEQNNYGQRLQCFAIQQYVMSELKEDVVTLDCFPERSNVNLDDGRFFHAFERECMKLMRPGSAGFDALSGCSKIIFGGDQVFNFGFNFIYRYVYDRSRTVRNVFSYGAGLNPSHKIGGNIATRLAPHMIAYGLREDANDVDYVKVVDPVFLIKDRWSGFARRTVDSGGLVTYIVRNGSPAELSVSHDGSDKTWLAEPGRHTVADPREFLGAFSSAKRVVTNSFHGLCFSLIFKVPRINILNREDHRIKNLVDMLGIKFSGDAVSNYGEVSRNIDKWCEKSRRFIDMCMNSSPKDYCAYSRNKNVRDRSSSGGFFAEAAKSVFAEHGAVYGGAFSDDFKKVLTCKVESMDEYFRKLSKSKYNFCHLPRLRDLKEVLTSGRKVLFIGSPCQISAVRKYCGDIPDSCILCDFRCRGYSRPSKLAKLVDDVKKAHGTVTGIDFRPDHKVDKIEVTCGGIKTEAGNRNDFVFGSMDMCKRCRFGHGMLSCADITAGDFWRNSGNRLGIGQEFTPEKGCNILSVNTEKGRALFESVRQELVVRPLFSE